MSSESPDSESGQNVLVFGTHHSAAADYKRMQSNTTPSILVQGQDLPFVLKLRDADRFVNLQVKYVRSYFNSRRCEVHVPRSPG